MAKIEKNKLIEKVKELEGLSNDEKAALIGYIKTKTYGLVWEDSNEKAWEQLKDYIPVLTEDKSKAIINDTDEQKNPNHILIEGDNLLALTNLCFTHEGKVDVIYIDPPYNTGNKDFVYNDKFINKDDEYHHSQWLSFIKKRISTGKRMLKPDGIMFISIGSDEVAQLILLCNELFGESNQVAIISRVQKKGNGKGTHFSPAVDYVLAYAKDKDSLDRFFTPNTADFPILETEGKRAGEYYECSKSLYQGSLDSRPNQRYYIECPDGSFIIPPGNVFPELVYDASYVRPIDNNDKCWRWSWESYLQQKDLLVFKRVRNSSLIDENGNQSAWNVYTKRYQKDAEAKGKVPPNYIDDCINSLGTSRLSALGIDFSFSKPCELISKLIQYVNKGKEIIVVDFFAGSGTTLDAIMQINASDGGKRRCILVQVKEFDFESDINPESGEIIKKKIDLQIAEKITYERNKRVIKGYGDIDGLKQNNLRYFKVGYVPREKDLTNIERFARQSVNLLCIKEDVYKEQAMFGELEADGFRYFKDGDKQFLVILEPDMIEPIIEEITKMDYKGKMPVYVFTTGHYPYTEDFWQVSEKVDLYPYPTCVYGACEKVMPKVEDKLLDQPDDIELSDEEANMTFEDLNKE